MSDEKMDAWLKAVDARMDQVLTEFVDVALEPKMVAAAYRIAAALIDESSANLGRTFVSVDTKVHEEFAQHVIETLQTHLESTSAQLRDQAKQLG